VTAEERAEINDIKRLIRLLAWCGEKVSEGTIEAFPLNEEQRAVLAVQRDFRLSPEEEEAQNAFLERLLAKYSAR